MKLRHARNPISDRRKNKIFDEYGPVSAAQTDSVMDWARTDQKPNKGLKNGVCNRQACQAEGAIFFNHGTMLYYCGRCAHDLNTDRFNREDAQRLWGHPLCQLDADALQIMLDSYKDVHPRTEVPNSVNRSIRVAEHYSEVGNILAAK